MRTYAMAQNIGTRSHQCDATAVYTAPGGARAYALLDGIGSSDAVRDWTRNAARQLARAAARRADAEAGLRAVYSTYAAEPDRQGPWGDGPNAAAVVAVAVPGKPLTVAWCGDSRAYILARGNHARRLTADHNLRRVHPPTDTFPTGGNRNIITSYLGATRTDDEASGSFGHPAIESTAWWCAEPLRLVLASDGAYEPHEDADEDLAEALAGTPHAAARRFVESAVSLSLAATPDRADNATVLVADVGP
ncbi:PP2C family protein-serine/threonine phosphatase [Streptomyces sp. NPDC057456]|uniref:PP2C family protein-serine/threonine phosphatase n=1 Tax=Streptomyces sp. NPDC057456 TaxID=3346139 RepID=UPI0036BB26FD